MRFWRANAGWKDCNGAAIPSAPIQSNEHDVPLEVAAEAWKEYDAQGHGSQSLERLNERGGFGASELAIFLYERIKRLEKQIPLLILACLALSACGTVAPKAVVARQASWSTNVQTGGSVLNSGVIGSDEKGFHVGPDFLERYDSYLALFGDKLAPTRKPGDRAGITPESTASPFYAQGSRWVFDVPAHARFRQLNTIHKAEDAP